MKTRYTLRKRDQIPGRNWTALVPATGAILKAPSRIALLPKISAHLRANNLPPMASPEEDIDDFICAAMNDDQRGRRCKIVPEGPVPERVASGIADMLSFVRFVKDNGFSFVSQKTAENRAAICASCPYLAPVGGCGACALARMLLEKTTSLLGKRSTSFDNMLGKRACSKCGCSAALKVHVNINKDYRPGISFPEFCWQRSENL